MTLPEQGLPKRRRQILDDETGDAHHSNPREYEGSGENRDTSNKDSWEDQDTWVKHFVARLAGLVRNFSDRS